MGKRSIETLGRPGSPEADRVTEAAAPPTPAPLVSICVPAYNVGAFLHEALTSVLAQTYAAIEVVLVDDGSTDETPRIAREFRDERLRYVRNPVQLGGYQTMNRGLALARGELVAVYHSDDVYDPSIVEKEVGFLLSHPEAGAVFCMDHYIDDSGRVIGGTSLPAELAGREILTYEDVFPFLLRGKNVLLRCPTFMARRDVLEAVGPFDAATYDIAADLDLWIRILRRFPIGILNERLMSYRAGRNQWSTRYNYLRTEPERFFAIMDRYLAEDGWLSRISESDLREYAFHRCADETFRGINWLLKGEPARARELLERGYPWGALGRRPGLSKVKLLVWRALLSMGIRARSALWSKKALYRLAYRRRFVPSRPATPPFSTPGSRS